MSWHRRDFLKTLGWMGLGSFYGMPSHLRSVNDLIKPDRLKEGDTIGLISPASILNERERYDEIIETIEKLGFSVKEGKHARNQHGDFAGTDRERAEDLNLFFEDREVDAIMAYRGGWGSNRILHKIDYKTIQKNPKPLIGFSDITALLMAIYAKTGLVTFHGPVGKSEWTDFTRSAFKNVLMEPANTILNNKDGEIEVQTITGGSASGKLLGGNLTVLTSMLGSDYLPTWKDAILFVEDVGEEVYRIDRMLTQLHLNGILDKLNGFIFGRCTDCKKSNKQSLSLEQILKDHIKPINKPAFFGSMIGHIDNQFTLPIGIEAEINADTGSIKLLEQATI